ncbi:MAG: hypothetical protein LBD58_05415 [Treponema sp.]|jgi:hypothetical protein|nr:hypothetical protein [Treponema sp.]
MKADSPALLDDAIQASAERLGADLAGKKAVTVVDRRELDLARFEYIFIFL